MREVTAAAICLLLLVPEAAHAAEPVEESAASSDDVERRAIDRTWLYTDDARIPRPLTVIASSSVSYTSVGASPTRVYSPYSSFASNTAQPGAMMSVGGELGLVSHVSVAATGMMGVGGESSGSSFGALVGVRVSLLPESFQHLHVVVSGGYLREAWQGPIYDDDRGTWSPGNPHGDNGAWLSGAISGDIRRLRLAATVHGEHVFVDGRDPVDLMVQAGASYRLIGGFRLGAEYVGQDLEESVTPGAEQMPRHFAGPVASLQLLSDRLSIVAGPAMGLSSASPQFLGRVGASCAF
jgi:hypothetical protein